MLTALMESVNGKVCSPQWMTSRDEKCKSTSADRIDGVTDGETVRLISKPTRRLPRTMSRSGSAPEWVRQKKHSSGSDLGV